MPIRILMSMALVCTALAASAAEPVRADDPAAVAASADAPASETATADIPAPPADFGSEDALNAEPSVTALEAHRYGGAADPDRRVPRCQLQLTASIDAIERETSRYDRSLAQPLMLLGDALSGQGKYAEALPTYERARHVIRVNDGLHSPEQVDVLYREASALAALGDIEEANGRQEYAYETLFRNHDKYDAALVPGVLRLAAWYEQTLNLFAARQLYEYAALIETRAHGEMDPGLIPPLQGVARTYREERFPAYRVPQAEEALGMSGPGGFPTNDRQITINRFGDGERRRWCGSCALRRPTNATPLDVALAEMDLADWYLLFDNDARATTIYVHAVRRCAARAASTAIGLPPASRRRRRGCRFRKITGPRGACQSSQGHVEVGYTLTARGECTDLQTITSQPED
jgi:tetratricopeptide (TPR) repeat protein